MTATSPLYIIADKTNQIGPLQSRPSLPRGGVHRDLERPGTATFFLTAPFKPAVHLAGDFNRWRPHATPMHSDGQGLFWVTIPLDSDAHSAPHGRIRYQFVVTVDDSGKQVWVADPYARKIAWSAWGPESILANDPPYTWHDQDWQRPPLRDLVIYELCVRDFTGQKHPTGDRFGRFAGVQAKLAHLQTLGIDAIELMPISEFPGDSSWGYNPVFYMAPKWIYGRPSELKALVAAAHQRGIAVILDLVFNHAWGDHPYYQMYPPLFGPGGEMLPDLNPFFHHHNNGHANSWGGLDWDHHSAYTRAYMQDIVRFWLEEYHMDGFRFDWIGGVEFDPWQPYLDRFDPAHGIAPIARTARETDPACYLIGEYWPIDGTNYAKTAARLVRETEVNAVWNGAFHHALENCLFQTWQWERQDLRHALGEFQTRGFERADQVINYVVSHDERRPEHEIQFRGEHIQLADPEEAAKYKTRWELALQKGRLGLAVLVTLPGVPMLFAGQEFGEDSPRTIEFWPLDWTKLEIPQGRQQFEFYQRLLHLRHEHLALRSDHIEFYNDDFRRFKVLRYKRWDGDDVVVVAANFDCVAQKVGLGFPHDGRWHEVIAGATVEVQGHWRDFIVPPWSAIVLVPKKILTQQWSYPMPA